MWRFVVDRVVRTKPYPNLAQHPAEPYTPAWREFNDHYPYTVPAELINHCEQHGYAYTITATAEYKNSTTSELHWYPVQWGWFSFDIDYVALLPADIKRILRNNTHNLRILFYYHEGDDPANIKLRLDALCANNNITADCYRLVTGNTASDSITGCVHFCDHELLYYMRNKEITAKPVEFLKTGVPMRSSFLLLSRTHKWWRAAVVTAMRRRGLLESAVWSYNTTVDIGDRIEDCPVQLDTLDLRSDIDLFLSNGPYTCDNLDAATHNDHSVHLAEHYDSTACSIILETHFDADGSNGAFLTEKTFKCIKHGHPFVLFAPPGSLASLRSMGYRTFDTVIDNSYDCITDNTERYLAVIRTVKQLALINPNHLYNACVEDLRHNQALFLASKWSRLNTLYERLHNEYK